MIKAGMGTTLLAAALLCFGFSATVRGQVVINEFMAINDTTLADEDGDFSDWIELHNPTAGSVSLWGWSLTDNSGNLDKWLFPNMSLAAGQYLVVFASGKDRAVAGSELHTDFQLDGDGEYLALVKDSGATTVTEFAPYPAQRKDVSYGLRQNTTALVSQGDSCRYDVPSNGTLEATWFTAGFSDAAWTENPTALGFSSLPTPLAHYTFDIDGRDSVGANHGTLNGGASIVPGHIGNAVDIINDGDYVDFGATPGSAAALTVAFWMKADVLALGIPVDKLPASGTAGWTFKLRPGGDVWFRVGSEGSNTTVQQAGAYSVGAWVHVAATYDAGLMSLYIDGLPGPTDVALSHTVNNNTTPLRVGKPSAAAVGEWFNGQVDDLRIYDRALPVGEIAQIAGAGNSFSGTDVSAVMQGINSTVWARIHFNVTDPAAFDSLLLRMRYEDGFAAFLNGTYIDRRNSPATLQWNSVALSDRPNAQSANFEDIDATSRLGSLVAGNNILAIQGLNENAADPDFLILPELIGASNQTSYGYLDPATPGGLNSDGYVDFVADPVFSVGRGFYASTFGLTISCATPGATLSYTLDGSEPSPINGTLVPPPNGATGPSTTFNITRTDAVRAGAFKTDYLPTVVQTHTYIFVNDVVQQDYAATLARGFPAMWGPTTPDYGMDPDIIGPGDLYGGIYAATIRDDLKDIPTLSIVMNIDDMFGPSGIYTNSTSHGVAWERASSAELINPDGTPGFQVNCGIRIQGGAFRNDSLTKKHSLRLLFKGIYGPTKLRFPWLGADAVDRFDTLTLRGGANDAYAWRDAFDTVQYTRDEFGRSLQQAAGHVASHGTFVHLYINGVYWGLYNPVERPDNAFSASYFGGEKDDWDAINSGVVSDGTIAAWDTMISKAQAAAGSLNAYQELQGNNPDGSNNPAFPDYLDVENYVDYWIINIWGGNWDWPGKNFWVGRSRTADSTGFKSYMWDFENTMGNNRSRSPLGMVAPRNYNRIGQPQFSLQNNAEYRMRFADEVHRMFFNGGILTPEALIPRYSALADWIERAIVAESARWGDTHYSTPKTLAEWYTERDWILGAYLPQRSAIVLGQFIGDGLYPSVVAPVFTPQHGGAVPLGFQLTVSAPAGTIYYTLDGTDPRQFGGAPLPSAPIYSGTPVTINGPVYVSARAYSGGVWSALNAAAYTISGETSALTISEVMYNPLVSADFEYLELHNPDPARSVVLDGYAFTNGIDYTFPAGTLIPPGGYLLVTAATNAGDFAAFRAHYGLAASVPVVGPYGMNLGNGGEQVTLRTSALGPTVLSFAYSDGRGWPLPPDGGGHSLVPLNEDSQTTNSLDYGGHWRASTDRGGSPGAADPAPPAGVTLNEFAAHTDTGNPPPNDSNDWIELHNPTGALVTLNDYYLSDDVANLTKWAIPNGTAIGAGGFLDFDEAGDFHNPTGFGLNKAGEQLVLSHLPAAGQQRIVDSVRFKGQEGATTLGRYPDGDTYWFPMAPTRGVANAAPNADPVFNEIMYHPGDGTTVSEFLEIYNPTNQAIPLWNVTGEWRLAGGISYTFPPTTTLPPYGLLLVVHFDPADAVALTAFKATYGVATINGQVLGPFSADLSNHVDRIALERPQAPDQVGDSVSWVIVDETYYFDQTPFPVAADGGGSSLHRVDAARSGNEPANWTAATPDPGGAATVARPQINLLPASNIASQTARLNGEVVSTGGENPTVRFYWDTVDGGMAGANWRNWQNVGVVGAGPYSLPISSLSPSTLYYFQTYAFNSGGTRWAASGSFTTTAQSYTLTVTSAANGTVTRAPNQPQYNQGALVILTPVPSAGYSFSHWTGDVPPGDENDNPLQLTINGNVSLTAHFTSFTIPALSVRMWRLY